MVFKASLVDVVKDEVSMARSGEDPGSDIASLEDLKASLFTAIAIIDEGIERIRLEDDAGGES